MAASSLSLTEELFLATSLHQYRETLQPIMPGKGISEKMFPTSRHTAKYELDMRLTYKVNKYKRGKTTKTIKVINPNIMFTLFSVFGERLPGQVRKDMVEWIESNLEVFKSKVFMAMAVLDMYFDSWLDQVKSNETIGDGFCLSTLCQMSQHHALVVTVEKIWMTIPPNFLKTDDEICRLYDIHLLYMCWDTYAV